MDKSKTPDEQPKKKVARSVVTNKRRYFVPAYSVSVEATSPSDAVEVAKDQVKRKDGDG